MLKRFIHILATFVELAHQLGVLNREIDRLEQGDQWQARASLIEERESVIFAIKNHPLVLHFGLGEGMVA